MTRRLAQLSLILALLFEIAVVKATPGVGYLLFWAATLAATALANRAAERPPLPHAWMFLPSLAFALSVTLYDASAVRFWSTSLGLLSLLWAAGWNLCARRDGDALARLYPQRTFHLGHLINASGEVWKPLMHRRDSAEGQTLAVLRGVLLTAPLLLLFGALLTAADAVFEKLLVEAFQGVSLSLPLRLLLFCSFVSAWLRLWLSAEPQSAPRARTLFGAVEMRIALGSLSALFALFLIVQTGYLFGGSDWLAAQGLSHAQYARSGFFELTACIALLLPVVMLAYQTAVGEKDTALRWMGGLLILQAGGLALSAYSRMLLYISQFGLSVERFYAASGILVALVVLGWAAYACGSPRQACWVVSRQTVSVLFLLGALSLVNVEALIVRTNIERARQGSSLDLVYLQSFSSDAIDALKNSVGVIGPKERLALLRELSAEVDKRGGFSWNLSRWKAQSLSTNL